MNRKLLYISLLLVLFVSSCGKDYLELEPTERIGDNKIEQINEISDHLSEAGILGIYAKMIQQNPRGSKNDVTHYDYGQKNADLTSDLLSGDLVLFVDSYGWYSPVSKGESQVSSNSRETKVLWGYYYYLIRNINILIASKGGNNKVFDSTETDTKYIIGQAKVLRAYQYFNLAMLYTNGYEANEKYLPIYKEAGFENEAAKTTKEVFEFIVKDLEDAILLLEGFTRPAKNYVDQTVATALLSYVYAEMNNYDKVAELTTSIKDKYPLTTKKELIGGFNDVNTPSWIWGIDVTSKDNLDLVSWWGHMDIYTYGYAMAGAIKGINTYLHDEIRNGDIRKSQFELKYNYLLPTNKFYHPAKTFGGQRVIEADYIFMRAEEIVLLNIEAFAKTGNETEAKRLLKEFLETREVDTSYIDSLSGQALKDEIFLQTRIELWGEGKALWALKRNKASVKFSPNHLGFPKKNIEYNDVLMKFLVPESEIINNPVYNN